MKDGGPVQFTQLVRYFGFEYMRKHLFNREVSCFRVLRVLAITTASKSMQAYTIFMLAHLTRVLFIIPWAVRNLYLVFAAPATPLILLLLGRTLFMEMPYPNSSVPLNSSPDPCVHDIVIDIKVVIQLEHAVLRRFHE